MLLRGEQLQGRGDRSVAASTINIAMLGTRSVTQNQLFSRCLFLLDRRFQGVVLPNRFDSQSESHRSPKRERRVEERWGSARSNMLIMTSNGGYRVRASSRHLLTRVARVSDRAIGADYLASRTYWLNQFSISDCVCSTDWRPRYPWLS